MPTELITGGRNRLGQVRVRRLKADYVDLVVAGRLQGANGALHLQVEGDCTTSAGPRAIIEKSALAGRRLDRCAQCVGNIRLGALHRLRDVYFADCQQAKLISALQTMKGPAYIADAHTLIDRDAPPCK